MLCSSQSSFFYLKLEHRNSISKIGLTLSNLHLKIFILKKIDQVDTEGEVVFRKHLICFLSCYNIYIRLFSVSLLPYLEFLERISQIIRVRFIFCQLFLGVKKESKCSVQDHLECSNYYPFSLPQKIFVVTIFLPLLLEIYNRNFGLLEIFCLLYRLRDVKMNSIPFMSIYHCFSFIKPFWKHLNKI